MKIFFKILIVTIIFCSDLFSQNIDWQKVNVGINSNYLINTSDFNEHWGNSFSLGGTGRYKITDRFFAEGELNFSIFDPKNKSEFPKIYMFEIPLGFKYEIFQSKYFGINIWSGILNATMHFSGARVEERFQNNKEESEFGYFISMGTRFFGINQLEVYSKYESLFSAPENLKIYSIGLKYFIIK